MDLERMTMPINTRIHAILTESEQDAIVTALDFWYAYNAGTIKADDFEQGRLAFQEFGSEKVSDLATKIANLF